LFATGPATHALRVNAARVNADPKMAFGTRRHAAVELPASKDWAGN
jgi:hypothetical protein